MSIKTPFTNKHLMVDHNEIGRDFIVGDIHGSYTSLKKAMKLVKFDKKRDRLFAVGDVINRGAESYKCIKLFKKKWFFSVLGNHEIMLVNSILKEGFPYGPKRKSNWFKALTKEERQKVKKIAKSIIADLPHSITIQTKSAHIGICHADAPKNWKKVEKEKACPMKLAFNRKRISKGQTYHVKNIDLVFVGHTPQKNIKVLGNVVYTDTATLVSRGKLTLIECPDTDIHNFLSNLHHSHETD